MRRKVTVAFVATLVAFSFTGVAFAEHLTGMVRSADPSANTLTMKTQWGPITFRVEEQAEGFWLI